MCAVETHALSLGGHTLRSFVSSLVLVEQIELQRKIEDEDRGRGRAYLSLAMHAIAITAPILNSGDIEEV